ncbi:VOC family protein [Ancylobacter lacus]|uniref:VOC family protein n=1 Tax=Ancylobacter lacus TaxID=2579970 RepID=UPI001BD04FB7|nr:VOC family protein [Ancylobacter lacus]MBS7539278.1 VOC family protein [Ancylobacter lacus]
MLDHVSITVSDPRTALPFWDAVMAALGIPRVWRREDAAGYGIRNDAGDDAHSYLTVLASSGTVVPDNRHWCFRAPNRAAVDAFHRAALAQGGRCDGPPGLRPQYHAAYYAAFVLDPDGNRIEAVHHRVPD